jgi:hypothetical protein
VRGKVEERRSIREDVTYIKALPKLRHLNLNRASRAPSRMDGHQAAHKPPALVEQQLVRSHRGGHRNSESNSTLDAGMATDWSHLWVGRRAVLRLTRSTHPQSAAI